MSAFILLSLIASAQGGTSPALWIKVEGAGRYEHLGQQVESAGDVNADGVGDLIASNQPPGAHNGNQEAVVRVISGLDGAVLHTLRRTDDPNRTTRYGASMGGMDDFDLDGYDDFFVFDSMREALPGVDGIVHVYSGRNGSEIFRLASDASDEIHNCVQVGDLDGDGRRDFAVAARTDQGLNGVNDPGVIRAHSSGSGALLFRTEGLVEDGSFGTTVAPTEDMDLDGIPDLIVGATGVPSGGGFGQGAVYVVAGASGMIVNTLRSNVTTVRIGYELASAGDLDEDSIPDVLCAYPGAYVGSLTGAGTVLGLSGADGSLLFRLDGDRKYDYFGTRISGGSDYDGDGSPDFTVFSPNWQASPGSPQGAVFIYDRNAQEISRLLAALIYDNFGTEAILVGDLNGDSRSEIACGAPTRTGAGGEGAGVVELFGAETWLSLRPWHYVAGQACLSTLEVAMPPTAAGWSYLILASAGPPGSFIHGVEIPLTPDRLLRQFATASYPPYLIQAGLSGVLDGAGRAAGYFGVASQQTVALAGRSLRFAAVATPPGANQPGVSSSAIEFSILP